MKSARKPKCCQWVEGVCSPTDSTWKQCKAAPKFKLMCVTPDFESEYCVGWVCAEHAVKATYNRLGQLV